MTGSCTGSRSRYVLFGCVGSAHVLQPAWSRAREFEITTRNPDSSRIGIKTPTDQEFEEDDEFGTADDDERLVHGRRKRKVALTPSAGKSCVFYL